MTRIERSVLVNAPASDVWTVISELDSVADWNPNVRSATCGPRRRGLGATRICHLVPRGQISEVVSSWSEGREVWFAIGAHGGIRSADMGFALRENGTDAIVDAIAEYQLALGPVGPVIDMLTTKRLMSHMLEKSLDGLKAHVETKRLESQ